MVNKTGSIGDEIKRRLNKSNMPVTSYLEKNTQPTKRQQLMYQPKEDEKKRWYKGEQPTPSEALAQIYRISKTDYKLGEQLFNSLKTFLADPSTPLYSPYSAPTNQAVKSLSELGYDMSGGVTKDWLTDNSALMGYYRTGTSGAPLAPSNQSTAEQDAGYWFYKLLEAEDDTERAETEWEALQEEIRYWASRKDRNYSDDEVLGRIDWKDYPTLAKMDEGRKKGVPLALNRSVGYSQDALTGVLWAARNGQSTGNVLTDSVQYALGAGVQYRRNDDITARLDPTSDSYNPYAVGSTIDDAALYFGVSDFSADWLTQNKQYMAGDDKTAAGFYQKVYAAEQNTVKAEAEREELYKRIDDRLKTSSDPDFILDELLEGESAWGESNLSTLAKMDESRKSGDLMAMTRAVDYRWEDVEKYVRDRCGEKQTATQADDFAQDVSAQLGVSSTPSESQAAINKARDGAIKAAGPTIRAQGTAEERIALQTAYSSDYATYVQQIGEAIANGTLNSIAGYEYSVDRVNGYAAKNYMGAKAVITPYEEAVSRRNAALDEIARLEGQGATNPADFAAVSKTDTDGTIHFRNDIEGLLNAEATDREQQEKILELRAIVSDADAYIKGAQGDYDKAMQTVDRIKDGYQIAERLRKLSGAEAVDSSTALSVMDYAYFFGSEYEPTQWSAQTSYQAALDDGYTREQVSDAAKKGMAENQAEIKRAQWVLQQIKELGIEAPDDYFTNIERYIAKLQRDVTDAQYFLIADSSDFDSVVSEYKQKVKDAWEGYEILGAFGNRNGIPWAAYNLAFPKDVHAENLNMNTVMTDEERNTYLYIMATEGQESGEAYINHLLDPTYGILTVRGSNALQEYVQEMATNNPVGATLLSVVISPSQIIGSMYSGIAALTGNEINPYNSAFSATQIVSGTRETVKQNITEHFDEGTFMSALANIGYDVFTGVSDSLLNAALMGGVGFSKKAATALGRFGLKVTNSMISAAPMGLQAASNAVQDAKMRGATDEQALLLGGVTFLAETATEAITVSNIKTAWEGTAAEAKGFLRELIGDIFEEGFGEGLSEAITGVADTLIMDELSNRHAAIEQYEQEGMSPEEAEQKANSDFLHNVLYAAGVGALSGGVSTSVTRGVSALRKNIDNAMNPQQTNNVTPPTDTNASPADDTGSVPPATDESTPVENTSETPLTEPAATGEETSAAAETGVQNEPNLNADGITRVVTALDAALTTTDDASRVATIAGVLSAGRADVLGAVSAAAQHMANTYGSEDAVRAVRDILLTAAENGMEQEQVSVAITLAALTDGATSATLRDITDNGATAPKVTELVASSAVDMQGEDVQNALRAAVTENRIANRVKELIGEGALSGIQSYETAHSQARSNLREARAKLRWAQADSDTAGRNLQSVQAQYIADTSNMNLFGAVQQAVKDVEGKAIVAQQMEQSVSKYDTQAQEARKQLDGVRDSTMKALREQARAEVLAEQEAAALERAAQEAAVQEEMNAEAMPEAESLIPDAPAPQSSEHERSERQFATQTAQASQVMPEWIKNELYNNPDERFYDADTNREQVERAWERVQQSGIEAERDRLLSLERFSEDDTAEANLLMSIAFYNNDAETALALASHYNREGTKTGKELQARKLFSRMSPTGAKAFIGGQIENRMQDYMSEHEPKQRDMNARAEKVAEAIRALPEGAETTDSRWGVQLNAQQLKLIRQYGLEKVSRPGVHYNRATTKQRMLEAILATPNPLAPTGGGLTLVQRLQYMSDGLAVVTSADLDYIGAQLATYIGAGQEGGGRDADLAIARAFEAFGNITPTTVREKIRTQRYVNMLLSIPSALRNIIGNVGQNISNATAHGIATALDTVVGRFTGERTTATISMADRAAGWRAFADETKNTFRDYFIDRADTTRARDKYNTSQKGRVFQNPVQETARTLEGFLMSVGDRNFWRKAFVNSLAEQNKLNDRYGMGRSQAEILEQAEADASYATFTEDSAVRDALNRLKQVPVVGDAVDLLMPFTGVPVNITKRMFQFSPFGLVSTAIQHGYRAIRGKHSTKRLL